MLRRLHVLIFCLLLAVISNSCTDHEIPSALPELTTLPVTNAPSGIKCGLYFKVDVVSLGTTPVKEYGIVASGTGLSLLNPEPLINIDYKVVFDSPFGTGEKAMLGPQVCTNNMYYRAYALLTDDTVVYGNVIHFTNF